MVVAMVLLLLTLPLVKFAILLLLLLVLVPVAMFVPLSLKPLKLGTVIDTSRGGAVEEVAVMEPSLGEGCRLSTRQKVVGGRSRGCWICNGESKFGAAARTWDPRHEVWV